MSFSKSLRIMIDSRGSVRLRFKCNGEQCEIWKWLSDEVRASALAEDTFQFDSLWSREMRRLEADATAEARAYVKAQRGEL